MSGTGPEEFRSSLGDAIGRDIVYVTAGDENRHFDPLPFLQQYAGELLLILVTSAATGFWGKLKKAAEGLGKKVGEQLWHKAEGALEELTGLEVTSDDGKQLAQIPRATGAVATLGQALGDSYLDEFLEAGRGAVEERLLRDNFPKAKAARVSADFARRVKEQVRG